MLGGTPSTTTYWMLRVNAGCAGSRALRVRRTQDAGRRTLSTTSASPIEQLLMIWYTKYCKKSPELYSWSMSPSNFYLSPSTPLLPLLSSFLTSCSLLQCDQYMHGIKERVRRKIAQCITTNEGTCSPRLSHLTSLLTSHCFVPLTHLLLTFFSPSSHLLTPFPSSGSHQKGKAG